MSLRPAAACAALALTAGTFLTAAAQAPSATVEPSPAASVVSSAPSPLPSPPPEPKWAPDGPPNASVRADGLLMQLWLADTVAQPGGWVAAHVRVTNTGDRVRFHETSGHCVGDPFGWAIDLFPLFDPGREWPGLAGRLKGELTAHGPVPDWLRPDEVATSALAECTGPPDPKLGRLAPGASIDEDRAYRPTYILERPLPPGPITITASFRDWGGGRQPDRDHGSLSVESTVLLTGDVPGYPSPLVLIDEALSVPRFYRFLSEPPGERSWSGADWFAWPPTRGRTPDGYLEVGLWRGTRHLSVRLDPWTGELLP